MQIPLALADPVVVEEVSVPLWRETFDALGWPDSLVGKRGTLTHDDVLLSLRADPPTEDLFQAIEALHDFGSVDGRTAIDELLTDRQIPPGTLPAGLGEREFALRFFLAQRHDGQLAEVFSKAQIRVQDRNRTRFDDFVGKKARRMSDPGGRRHVIENELREYCRDADLGEYAQVRVFDDDDGACRFQIMHSHLLKTPMAVAQDSTNGRVKIQYRPIHADFVKYEPALSRLRITARSSRIVEFYRRVFGQVFFADDSFFYGNAVVSLRVLQDRGAAALSDHRVFGAGRVWMTECVWERGDRERLNISAPDCFETITKLRVPLVEGQLIQAKFKIEVVGKSARPVIATVRVPSRIDVKPSHEILVSELLTSIGIRGTHSVDTENDLWSLYPWRQPKDKWRDCFGAATDAFVRQGVLVPIQLESIEPRAHPGAGRILEAHQVSAGEFIGVSHTAEIPSQSLSATDVDGLELSILPFQNHLRALLGIAGNASPWSNDQWFVDLGVLSLHGFDFRIAYALRQPPHDASVSLKKHAGGVPPILLLPKGLKESTGTMEILLDRVLPTRQRVLQDIIAVAGLADKLPALHTARPGSRLVVDRRLEKIWFDEIEITGLRPGTHAYKFVEILASCAPSAVDKHQLAEHLSRASDSDQTARSAKLDANKAIRAALKRYDVPFEDPFKAQNGTYRLTVAAHVGPPSV